MVERAGIAATCIVSVKEGAVTRLATFPAARLILLLLAAGVALRLIWLALGLVRLRQYRKRARLLDVLPQRMQEIAMRVGAAPEFRLSEEIQSPVTFGVRHPVILLPPRFNEMDADRQQAIASHELLHVVRRDWAVNLVEEAVLAAFWFHPVIWWLVSRIRLSREQLVDQEVVELMGARKPYLYALVEIAVGPDALRGLMAPAFLNECQLAERIRGLVREDFMSKRRIIISLVCVGVLTLLAAVVVIRKFPLRLSGVPITAANVQPAPEVFSVGNGVTEPIPIFKPEPPYTKEAKAAKTQGTVILQTIIGADGAVKDVNVVKPLGQGLDQNAVNTIRTWKFKPALKAGQPVACRVTVEVSFKLF